MMCLVAALAFIAVVVSPQLLQGSPTCQMGNTSVWTDYVEGHSPVNLTTVPYEGSGSYAECVTGRVWIKADDFNKDPKIEIVSTHILYNTQYTIWPVIRKGKKSRSKSPNEKHVRCKGTFLHNNTSFALWKLLYNCVASARSTVTLSYTTTSANYSINYTVPDPIPDFKLSVNQSSKSINVTVKHGGNVHTRLCYKNSVICQEISASSNIIINPSQSRSALLNIPYLLPCVCVQVYYTHADATRNTKCPFQNESFTDVRDVWLISTVTLYESSLTLMSKCPASNLKISASLCWKQHEHLCTPVLNSTLEEKEDGLTLIYNTSAVDKHPQMCVQFSLQGTHNISCPFKADMSSWEVYIGPGKHSVFVYLISSAPATFSAQLCVPNERGCTPTAQVHSVRTEGNTNEKTRLNVPLHFTTERPCVQVWQSDPARRGTRILCPDYKHYRCGMYAVAVLTFVVFVAFLAIFIHRHTKNGAAGWLYIQKPVLLVCSSEQSAHVSAVCALASILQGELSATVHMALWALSSQRQAAGVADLGPIPWFHGQWEAIRKAQGKVLIIWSPEAKKTYEKWKEERVNMGKNETKIEDHSKGKIRAGVEEDSKLNGRRLAKCKKGKKDCVKLCGDDEEDGYTHNEPSTVIAPVFKAALACLEGVLQECKDQGVALVYFQCLGHSRDIPKTFRGVPRYCLPQDFRGLIQELGGMTRQTKTGKFRWHCWPRLLSKVLSVWLARQLSNRLQTLLPQVQGKKMQRVTSSQKMMSENDTVRAQVSSDS